MSDDQIDFGYTPKNLRYVLKASGVTQNHAGELINKARSTFGRYLHDVDNDNHVSMSHRDWLQLLHELKIPQHNLLGVKLQMNSPIKQSDISRILPTSKFFIGSRGPNGYYLPQITGDNTKEEFVDFFKNQLCADLATKDDCMEVTLNIEKLLHKVVDDIKVHINDANEELFKRIVNYDQLGFTTIFTAYFDRIVSSEYKSYEELGAKVLPLNAHFLDAFEDTKGYYYNREYNRQNSWPSQEYLSDIDSVEEFFLATITTLMMYMGIEYFGDKKNYHKNNNYVKTTIERIDKHIFKLINVDVRTDTQLIDLYLIERAMRNPDEFNQTLKILNVELNATEYADKVFKTLIKIGNVTDHGYETEKHEVTLLNSEKVNDYFRRLVKLYGVLNYIREIDEKLAQNSLNGGSDEVDANVHASFKMLLNDSSQAQSNCRKLV